MDFATIHSRFKGLRGRTLVALGTSLGPYPLGVKRSIRFPWWVWLKMKKSQGKPQALACFGSMSLFVNRFG